MENMHDIPYVRKEQIGPEVCVSQLVECLLVGKISALLYGERLLQVVSTMTMACDVVVRELGSQRDEMVLGVQVLAGANREAMAIANATGKTTMEQ